MPFSGWFIYITKIIRETDEKGWMGIERMGIEIWEICRLKGRYKGLHSLQEPHINDPLWPPTVPIHFPKSK